MDIKSLLTDGLSAIKSGFNTMRGNLFQEPDPFQDYIDDEFSPLSATAGKPVTEEIIPTAPAGKPVTDETLPIQPKDYVDENNI